MTTEILAHDPTTSELEWARAELLDLYTQTLRKGKPGPLPTGALVWAIDALDAAIARAKEEER